MSALVAAAVIAVVAALGAVARPRLFVMLGFVAIVFAKSLAQWTDGLLSYLDESIIVVAVVVLTVRRLASRRRLAWFPGVGWFMLFAALGLVSGVIAGAPAAVVIAGAFLALKGALFGFAALQIDWRPQDVRRIAVGGGVLLAITLAFVAANAIAPEWWAARFARLGEVDYILGLPSLVGPFTHPGDLGLVLGTAAIAVLAYRQVFGRGWISLILLGGSVLGAVASLRRKTVVGIVVALGYVVMRARGASRSIVIGLVVVVALVGVVAVATGVVGATITSYLVGWQESPRSLLTLGSLDVAARHFPWGAGFGRYGSFLAAESYSPEYVRLGFPENWVVEPGSPYLSDTQWPAILGEAGWFGLVAFAAGLVCLWRAVRASWRTDETNREERWIALVGMGWFIQVLIESIAAPVFVTSPSTAMVFVITAIAASMRRQRAEAAAEALGEVDRLVVYQWDPSRPSLGGVDTCLRGLATFHPDDVTVAFVGVSAPGASEPHELGVWQQCDVDGRSVWFLPVASLDPDDRRRVIPHGLRLAAGLVASRTVLPRAASVQGHKLESALVIHLLRPRSDLVYFIHSQGGALAARGSDSRWQFLGALQAWGERKLVAVARRVVVFNPAYAEELGAINPNTVAALTWFDPTYVAAGEHDHYRVLWVGRLEPPKDAPLALAAFRALCTLEPERPWHLEIVGAGGALTTLRDELAPWPRDLRERVILSGTQSKEQLSVTRSRSGVLIMTSVAGYEGVPRVLVEGLAAGLPAVVTDGSDTGSLVVEGVNGAVRGRDPMVLARAIIDVAGFDRVRVQASVSGLSATVLVPRLMSVDTQNSERRST